MRWEDRRPGEERANNQRGCYLPDAPTVPPILTPSSQPENPLAPKKTGFEVDFAGQLRSEEEDGKNRLEEIMAGFLDQRP